MDTLSGFQAAIGRLERDKGQRIWWTMSDGKNLDTQPGDDGDQHPKFIEAVENIERLEAAGQLDQTTLLQWLLQAVEYASDPLRAFLFGEWYREGRFPQAKHFTPDGKPIYTAAELAEHFEVTVEDIASNIKLMASQGILVIPPSSE